MTQRFYLILVLIWGASMPLLAQFVPQGFNYQGIIRDDNGNPLANQTVTLLFSIRSGASNGPVAYTEKQITNSNEYGLVNLVIGQGGTPVQGTFNAINWGSSSKYLSVSLETTPNVFDDLGTSQLLSVPYALYAQNTVNGGGSGDNWGSQVVQTTPSLSGAGTANSPLGLAPQGAQTGQVLKWDGTKWIPQDDATATGTGGGTVTQINTGAGLTGGPITTSGTIGLNNSGVVPGTYGTGTTVPVITVDAFGRITTINTVNVQGGTTITLASGNGINIAQNGDTYTISNTGDTNASDDLTNVSASGGDVNGPFANLQLNAGVVGSTELADGAVSNAKIANAAVSESKIADGAISNTKIAANAVTSDKIADNTVGTNDLADNAVSTVKILNGAIIGNKIGNMGAANGQVLKWNGTTWAPANDDAGGATNISISSGAGIAVTGVSPNFTITNSGDTNSADDITINSQSGGDVTGLFSNLQLKGDVVSTLELTDNAVETANIANGAVTGTKIAQAGATSGQVLKWNGSTWAPANDNTGGGGGGTVIISPGVAIDVILNGPNNYTISNAGDVDPFDDITILSQAGGDLTGPFTNLQLNPFSVTNAELNNNAVNTNNVINGAITGPKIAQAGATIGQVLKWNGTTWAPASDQTGVGDNWGTQTVATTPLLSGNGTAANPLTIAQQAATSGQILKWNGTSWAPAADLGPDNWGSQTVLTDATLSGNGAGTPLKIAKQGANTDDVLKWNGATWAPAPDAGGDNWGAQVAAVGTTLSGDGTAGSPLNIAQQMAANGQVLKWNTGLGRWAPANDLNTGDNWGAQSVHTTPVFSGTGIVGDPLDLSSQGAMNGQVLKWDASMSQWLPSDDQGTGTGDVYVAGTGINITGLSPNFTINNTGDNDNNPNNEIQTISLMGSSLSLSLGGGSVLLPSGNTYTAGSGINISGAAPNFTIANTGDLSTTNELQTLSLMGNNLSLSNGGGSVSLPSGNTYNAGAGISITGAAPNFTINNLGDADADPMNEMQTLALMGSTLSISGSGSSVDLSTLGSGSNHWTLSGSEIFNSNSGSVMVGAMAGPLAKFHVSSPGTAAYFNSTGGAALVTDKGNVGIGLNNPTHKLHVKGNAEMLQLEGNKAGLGLAPDPGLSIAQLFLGDSSCALVTNAAAWDIELKPNGLPSFIANSANGNVGIGGANATNAKLKVKQGNGGLMLENASGAHNWELFVDDGVGNLVLYNDQTGGTPAGFFAPNGFYSPSDRRLKKDIQAIGPVSAKLLQLEPVIYHFNQDAESAPMSVGFIAQDVQALFPEFTQSIPTKDGSDYLAVNYAGISVIAVKALQEQQIEIDALRTENEVLQARMNDLDARLKALEEKK